MTDDIRRPTEETSNLSKDVSEADIRYGQAQIQFWCDVYGHSNCKYLKGIVKSQSSSGESGTKDKENDKNEVDHSIPDRKANDNNIDDDPNLRPRRGDMFVRQDSHESKKTKASES